MHLARLPCGLELAALNSHQPLRDSIALQRELRDRLDETMVLSVWGSQGPTIVHVEESSQPIIMTMRVGAVLPILATASGLVFAAFLPRLFTQPLIKTAFKAEDGLNLFARDLATINRLIKQVREQGYAYNEEHLMPGVDAAAFPLFDRTTTLVAVLAVMGRHERVNPRDGIKMIACLKKGGRKFWSIIDDCLSGKFTCPHMALRPLPQSEGASRSSRSFPTKCSGLPVSSVPSLVDVGHETFDAGFDHRPSGRQFGQRLDAAGARHGERLQQLVAVTGAYFSGRPRGLSLVPRRTLRPLAPRAASSLH